MKFNNFLPLIGALILASTFGYLVGRIIDQQITFAAPSIMLIPDERSTVPVVKIDGIRNGNLEGKMSSGVRLFLGDHLIQQNSSGTFSTSFNKFMVNHISVIVPEGMIFIASKRGKNYYRVNSSAGERISPSNRVYFKTEEEARNAGFKKGK